MKILQLISTLNPSYGGPVEGLRQMGLALKEQGHEVLVLALDDPGASWIKDFPVTVLALGPSYFKYRFNFRLVRWLQLNAGTYDAVIVNGVWQFHSFGVWLALRNSITPYFVYTHGMLDPWFKSAFPLKHFKKQIYWFFAECSVLNKANKVIFTTEEERQLAKNSFKPYSLNEVVINFGISGCLDFSESTKKLFHQQYPELIGKKCILFLSRIHQKKGCDLLIEAFAKIYKNDDSHHLVIIGNDQEGLRANFEKLAETLCIGDRITWTGMVSENMKWSSYHACEVFILPSHSENFGSAVVEALSVGKPVLITNKVNIWREIQSYDAGYVENDDLDGAVNLLSKWSQLGEVEKRNMGLAAQKCFRETFEIESAAAKLSQYLSTVLNEN